MLLSKAVCRYTCMACFLTQTPPIHLQHTHLHRSMHNRFVSYIVQFGMMQLLLVLWHEQIITILSVIPSKECLYKYVQK